MPAIHSRPAKRDKYLPCSLLAECLGALVVQLMAGAVGADAPLQAALVFAAVLWVAGAAVGNDGQL